MSFAPPPHGAATPVGRSPRMQAAEPARRSWLREQWTLVRRPRLEFGWASLRGAGHSRNQDAVLAAPPLFAVADGVGGGDAGELASSALLAWCRSIGPREWRDADRLAGRLRGADQALRGALEELSPGGTSATTLAATWLGTNGRGHLTHVGDTRILQIRPHRGAWQLTPLTRDHTYAHLNETPPPGGRPDDPARMVGVGAMGEPEVSKLRLRENDWLVLCSDGFHRFVPEATLLAQCQGARGHDLSPLAQQLARLALERGSTDDISVLLVRRNPVAGARAGFWLAGALAIAMAAAAWLLPMLPMLWSGSMDAFVR